MALAIGNVQAKGAGKRAAQRFRPTRRYEEHDDLDRQWREVADQAEDLNRKKVAKRKS
jgi:hypothetical protein